MHVLRVTHHTQGDFALLGVPKNNFSLPLAQDLLAAVQVREWNGYKERHCFFAGLCTTLFLCLRCQPQKCFRCSIRY
jgi:hypothetical protein